MLYCILLLRIKLIRLIIQIYLFFQSKNKCFELKSQLCNYSNCKLQLKYFFFLFAFKILKLTTEFKKINSKINNPIFKFQGQLHFYDVGVPGIIKIIYLILRIFLMRPISVWLAVGVDDEIDDELDNEVDDGVDDAVEEVDG